jgi:predicted acylesterase/phospholipase RssA
MRALVLSGGGAHGAYQVGVLRALVEGGIEDYKLICGISVGALNAAFLAQYPIGQLDKAVNELAKFWRGINTKSIYNTRTFGVLSALWSESVFDSRPLQKMVRSMFDGQKIQESGRLLRIGAVCWETGEYRSVTEATEPLVEWILASSSYPVFFLPVEIDGLAWSDGGLRHVTPIEDAFSTGAREIDAIVCENTKHIGLWSTDKQNALPGYFERGFSVVMKELAKNDLECVGVGNCYAKAVKPYDKCSVRVMEPSVELSGSSLTFDPDDIAANMELGYEDGLRLAVTERLK